MTDKPNKQIEKYPKWWKEHKRSFECKETLNVFHNSINNLRDLGWTSKELNKHIKEHFEILYKKSTKRKK